MTLTDFFLTGMGISIGLGVPLRIISFVRCTFSDDINIKIRGEITGALSDLCLFAFFICAFGLYFADAAAH